MKLWNVTFEYTDTGSTGVIAAETEAQAIEGAKVLVGTKVPAADNFKATEISQEVQTSQLN